MKHLSIKKLCDLVKMVNDLNPTMSDKELLELSFDAEYRFEFLTDFSWLDKHTKGVEFGAFTPGNKEELENCFDKFGFKTIVAITEELENKQYTVFIDSDTTFILAYIHEGAVWLYKFQTV